MNMKNICFASILALSGCISASPIISAPELEELEKNAQRHNEAVKNVISNQVLLNIVRAQHHDLRRYTTISDVTMNPGGSFERNAGLSGPGFGNNVGDPWGTLSSGIKATSNDKLSYTYATATNSSDKDFSEVRYNSETLNEFWLQTWPRSMLIDLFFQEQALKIVEDENIFSALRDYFSGTNGNPKASGNEPFYVTSDNGRLSYCLNSIEACITKLEEDKTKTGSESSSDSKLEKVDVSVSVKHTGPDKPSAAKKPKAKYIWTDQKSELHEGKRTRDIYAERNNLSEIFAVRPDKAGVKRLPKFELIYCSTYSGYNIVSKKDYFQSVDLDFPRPISTFICSTTLADVDKSKALPYFLVLEGTKKGIYGPRFNTFDESTYLLGRALRPGNTMKKTEERFCNPFDQSSEDCKVDTNLLEVYTDEDLQQNSLEQCKDIFFASVKYRGLNYYAGLPEPDDAKSLNCVDRSMTSSTLILLAKIAEYSIKKPTNTTQLLLTQ